MHRVVIIGAGFGGLFAAKRLKDVSVDVTVVDRNAYHLFQPLLYQVATGILSQGAIAPAIRDVLRKQRNTRVVLGEVIDVDLDGRTVRYTSVDRQDELPYDSLVVAAGAAQSYFGHDEFAVHAPGLKTVDDALEVRGRIFGAFELAELEPDPGRRRTLMTFVVVGAGPTGVEMAGQIAELARLSLRSNYRRIDPADARILLLDGAPRMLGPFAESLAQKAADELRRLGVEIEMNAMVVGVDPDGVDVKDADGETRRIDAATKIWSAGVQASPLGALLAKGSGATLTRSGQVQVEPDCTLPGHPEVFVVGDMMALDQLPGLAEVAMQTGRHAATQIARRLEGAGSRRRFRYLDLGSLAAISRYFAIGQRGRIRIWGPVGWIVWLVVHLTFLTGFKNRVSALFHWTISFFGRSRGERTITMQQVFARRALQESGRQVE
jgi:NADH:ubiquinone reductase (H+-translocating)